MNAEVKKKWLEALRSGEYKQTHGVLKDSRGFCCLGVLCALHSQSQGGNWGEDQHFDRWTYLGNRCVLPSQVVDWSGLHVTYTVSIKHPNDDRQTTLAHLNDYDKFDFNQIADVIEKQL